MAERTVLGVDFSGAKAEGKTWVAWGRMSAKDELVIRQVHPVLREDLMGILVNVPQGTVVALDFPFGLPGNVLEFLGVEGPTMDRVWPRIAAMGLETYKAECKGFGKHPKRVGDHHYPVSLSALNSRLVPMTYRGIEMLHGLTRAAPDRWCVPPLDCGESADGKVTLLEVMPGAVLQAFGLDHATVKGYKNARNSFDARNDIIGKMDALAAFAGIGTTNLHELKWAFRANEDCLDSVIAALAAAAWASGRPFLCPGPGEHEAARLEGWIYAPRNG